MSGAFDRLAASLVADPNIGSDAIYTPAGEAPLALRATLLRNESEFPGTARAARVVAYTVVIPRGAVPDRPARGELISVTRGGITIDLKVETAQLEETGAYWRVTAATG